ncbi:TetR/AcrR family transcriptional regulator [Bacillus cereus]|uniref:TetR/AcrR family transcriptional regulator n=1 Tax=Bacillus cereus TaxID=1396 RepID=UPI000AD5AF09|nr:TetR/AcrR family transcriptional regulator [Bacillus cereus]
MANKIDLRVIKTQRAIKNTFIQLIEEVGFEKVNVRKLIERAEVNRSTFYLHYQDKYDLLNKIEDELLEGLKQIIMDTTLIKTVEPNSTSDSRLEKMNKVAYYLFDNKKIIRLLTSGKGDPIFLSKIGGIFESIWIDKKVVIIPNIPKRYAFAVLAGMLTNLIGEWIRSDFEETPEQFSQIVVYMTKELPKSLVAKYEKKD